MTTPDTPKTGCPELELLRTHICSPIKTQECVESIARYVSELEKAIRRQTDPKLWADRVAREGHKNEVLEARIAELEAAQ